jgi:pimeloyl-ACP methyl ester carboxylesterase
MLRKHFDAPSIAAAIDTWHALIGALAGKNSWETARAKYAAASSKPWFSASLLPFFVASQADLPPPAEIAEGMRREILYDPGEILQKVRTPTLALFGVHDRNVDVAYSIPRFKAAFTHAAAQDFTLHVFQDAGHTLKVSAGGFNDQLSEPERLTAGYPQIMLEWLRHRGFLHD